MVAKEALMNAFTNRLQIPTKYNSIFKLVNQLKIVINIKPAKNIFTNSFTALINSCKSITIHLLSLTDSDWNLQFVKLVLFDLIY